MCVFKPKVQVLATVNACSAALLTAMMNYIPKCVCEKEGVLLWIEIAASAGREHDKVGVLLRNQQAVVSKGEEGSGNMKKVKSEV